MSAGGGIWFCGDVHGDIRHLRRALDGAAEKPRALVLLGDLDPPGPVGEWLAPLGDHGVDVWFIHGNHETDSDLLFRNMFESPGSERNIDGRVVPIGGLRVAGLGGVFREHAWHPPAPARHGSYAGMAAALRARMPRRLRPPEGAAGSQATSVLCGKVRKHRSSIFPDVYHRLADQQADVLVVHEAPSCHPHGFEAIDLLAEAMGARWVVHGHHHVDYWRDKPGQAGVLGVGFRRVGLIRGAGNG